MAALTQQDFAGFNAVMASLLRVHRGVMLDHRSRDTIDNVRALERVAAMGERMQDTLNPHMERVA